MLAHCWFILAVFVVLIGIIGCLFCILRPFHRNNTYLWARVFGSATRILGVKLKLKVRIRMSPQTDLMFMSVIIRTVGKFLPVAATLPPNTVTLGKKA